MTREAPVAVLVSGSPGSGKTTLARRLADELALPHLNKDSVRDGMRFTSGPASTLEALVWEALYSTVEAWLECGVSLIIDFTAYKGVTETEFSERVMARSRVLNVHCTASDALDRFEGRIASHPHFGEDRQRVSRQREAAAAEQARWLRPLSLGCPVLEVNTSNAYSPDVPTIKSWILERSGRQLPLARQARRRD